MVIVLIGLFIFNYRTPVNIQLLCKNSTPWVYHLSDNVFSYLLGVSCNVRPTQQHIKQTVWESFCIIMEMDKSQMSKTRFYKRIAPTIAFWHPGTSNNWKCWNVLVISWQKWRILHLKFSSCSCSFKTAHLHFTMFATSFSCSWHAWLSLLWLCWASQSL